jgi:hypothetical protein
MVDDVSEKVWRLPCHADIQHVVAWSEMLAQSTPPIVSTPISPFLDEHAFKSDVRRSHSTAMLILAEHAVCLDGNKARRILGFKPTRPKLDVDELRGIVKDFQDDGIWWASPCLSRLYLLMSLGLPENTEPAFLSYPCTCSHIITHIILLPYMSRDLIPLISHEKYLQPALL